MVPRSLIFSIAIGADYSYEVKNSEILVPAFFKHNNSFIATVKPEALKKELKFPTNLIFLGHFFQQIDGVQTGLSTNT
jgi:hypothetical protein